MASLGSLLSRVLGRKRHAAQESGKQSHRSSDEGDRREQLKKFAHVSAELSEMYSRHRDPGAAKP